MSIAPAKRPAISRAYAEQLLREAGQPINSVAGVALLGRRGYFRDAMGAPGANDVGLYDDMIALVTPTCFRTFNANTDPSRQHPGVAVLKKGTWLYKLGTHGITKPGNRRYEALIQAGPVTVVRDGAEQPGQWLGINIHRGGEHTTSSEGCQTIYRPQWDEFIAVVKAELERHGRRTIPYVLTER